MKKKTLIVCSSPYTVLNAINYRIAAESENFDIIIFTLSERMRDIAINLKCQDLFNNIYVLDDLRNHKHFRLLVFIAFIIPKLVFKYIGVKKQYPEGYEKVICQSYLFASLLSRLNNKADFYLIEDGLGSYVGRVSDPDARRKKMKLINRWLFRGDLIPPIKGTYVYQPQMMIGSGRLKPLQLPYFDIASESLYKSAFGYKPNDVYKNIKYIFVGAPDMHILSTEINGHTLNVYEFLNEYLLKALQGNIIFRPHPVEKEYKKYLDIPIDDIGNLWELECLEINDSSYIFSVFSTAAFIPKILFNKEPYLIFFLPLFICNSSKMKDYLSLIEKLKEIYVNKEKIIIIYSIQQFLELKIE